MRRKAVQPDRFERVVLTALKKQDTPESSGIWLNGPDVVKLLRKEHRAVVRMVRALRATASDTYSDPSDNEVALGYCECLEDIIDRLTRRA